MRIDHMTQQTLKTLIAGYLGIILLSTAQAATVQVDSEEGTFYLNLRFQSELLPDALITLLTDYENLNQVNPAITKSEVITPNNGNKKIVWKQIKGCITFFCRELEHTEYVTESENKITMMTIPEKSDFEMGHSSWMIMPGATGSRVKFSSVLKPSFSLPPLIGNWLMKQKLRDELHQTARLLGDIDAE
ncbi:MAG TPA: hypothetical protein DD827_05990 [Gammaproteobacteria bacterium]|jgi:hypothetical protein|nr:hypothetical protein [Gammaproteobacteria bacterium]